MSRPDTRQAVRRWSRISLSLLAPSLLVLSGCVPTSTATPTSAPVPTTAPAAVSAPSPAPSAAMAPSMEPGSPMPAASAASPVPSPMAQPAASPMAMASASASPSPMMVTTDIKSAADLRAVLDDLLQAHVYLAANTTGAALGGRQDEMQAASAALDDNTQALGQVIGAAYGPQAQQQFLQIWRAHIGYFVDYTQADATGDAAQKQKAESDLDGYRQQFDDFITGANPNLPKGSVAALLTPHVQTLEAVIDAQAGKDPDKAYSQLKMAADHMQMVGDPLAEAVAKQFPQKFPAPAADSKAADLRTTLNLGLQEHVYLTHDATSEAMRGDTAGFQAAAAALDQNTTELGQAIGSVYGDQAQQQFLQLWRAHIGFFVNYTQAVAAGDQAKKQQATSDLGGYASSFDTFITGANPNLPKGSVAQLLQPHITGLEAMIDDEHAKNEPAEYQQTVEAAQHMWMIGNALASAIQQQFPDKLPTS